MAPSKKACASRKDTKLTSHTSKVRKRRPHNRHEVAAKNLNYSVIADLVNDNNNAKPRKKRAKTKWNASDVTKILIICFKDGKEKQILVVLEGSIPYSDMPNVLDVIFEDIFPSEELLKDHEGYKLVHGYTEQRIEICKADDLKFGNDESQHKFNELGFQYLIRVQCPTVRFKDLNNFSKLFNSEKFSDVTLCVKNRVIYAHKSILANKSPVLEAKFERDKSKSQSKKVEIKNLDYNTLCDFVYYIYAGELKGDCTIVAFNRYFNLLVAADNYRVEPLKERCEEKLPLLLTTKNVLDCLLLASLHNAANLKKEAIDFIVKNAEKMISLPSYKSFLEKHTSLSIEIDRALAVKKHRTV